MSIEKYIIQRSPYEHRDINGCFLNSSSLYTPCQIKQHKSLPCVYKNDWPINVKVNIFEQVLSSYLLNIKSNLIITDLTINWH